MPLLISTCSNPVIAANILDAPHIALNNPIEMHGNAGTNTSFRGQEFRLNIQLLEKQNLRPLSLRPGSS